MSSTYRIIARGHVLVEGLSEAEAQKSLKTIEGMIFCGIKTDYSLDEFKLQKETDTNE